MASRSFTDPITSAINRRPASQNLRPGANTPQPRDPTQLTPTFEPPQSPFIGHATDATSGGAAGYGSWENPGYNAYVQKVVSSLPDVIAARLAQRTGNANDLSNFASTLQGDTIDFGDPNVIANNPTLLAALRKAGVPLDPNTAALANANTGGSLAVNDNIPIHQWGNSVIGQLKQAAEVALNNKLQSLGGAGFWNQGGYGSAINQSNIDTGQKIYGAGQTYLKDVNTGLNTLTTDQLTNANNVANAITKGVQTVNQNPSLYPINAPKYSAVGAGLRIPQSAPSAPQTNPNTFTPSPGGAGASATRTGGIPLPSLPKVGQAAPSPIVGRVGY